MKFGAVLVEECAGAMLAHGLRVAGGVFKKGRVLGAEDIAALRDAGYAQDDCDRVARVVRKEGIKRDAEVQVLEDVAALVFLRWYFAGFAEGRDAEQIVRIVAKTAHKMSPEGRAAAAALDLPVELALALDI